MAPAKKLYHDLSRQGYTKELLWTAPDSFAPEPFLLMGDLSTDMPCNHHDSPLLFCHVQDGEHVIGRVRVDELHRIALKGGTEPVVVHGICCHHVSRLDAWTHLRRGEGQLLAEIGMIIQTCFSRTADLKQIDEKGGVVPQRMQAGKNGWWRRKSYEGGTGKR